MNPKVTIHPLAELLAKKLFGINQVPNNERDKIVVRAVKAAVEWHESQIKKTSKPKLTKAQKVFVESLKEGLGEGEKLWCECFYPKEWRTAKSLEKRGLVEIDDNESDAKKSGWFMARLKGLIEIYE